MIVKEVRMHDDRYEIVTMCKHVIYVSLLNPPRFINSGTHIQVIKAGRRSDVVAVSNTYELKF